MSEVIVLSFLGLIAFLIVVLLIIVLNLNKKEPVKKASYKSANNSQRVLISMQHIDLPKGIEKIPKEQLSGIVSKMLRVYEKLEYNQNVHDFSKAQWHTWQVSMILKMYKSGLDLFISNPDRIFPKDFLQKSDKDLRNIMNDIMVKYKRDVEIHRNRDFLSRDIRWSGRDVGIIFYFLSKYQNFSEDLK